jgi:hypothetical protein
MLNVSLNLYRRHLNPGQRAMIANQVANMQRGRPELNSSIELFNSQTQAASLLNVSLASVKRAREVANAETPTLTDAVNAWNQHK